MTNLVRSERNVNAEQLEQMAHGAGFIAALDQSGGSTPGALALYGIPRDAYDSDDEMLSLMHAMRERIVTNPAFTGDRILAAILFEDTIDRRFAGSDAAKYLWGEKHVVPFVKVDKGLAPEENGARCMNPMPELDALLDKAIAKGVFGTKMRSFIHLANPVGVQAVVDQQFEIALSILEKGLVPILEPEIDIASPDKQVAESLLRDALVKGLDELTGDQRVMIKLTLPERDDYYVPLIEHPRVVRVVALSGGYTRDQANERLVRNHRMIASFSRALTEGLNVDMSDDGFTAELSSAIEEIYAASIT
ncbi:fructose bisphosphate aldolase [Ferrimicrobium sp.]|uniref:fructose bisphosphate aldolase n=1 Tax=Ferrimicrobium sp. TaxID=2926050 RepID=UPI00261CAC87|nr:fructose bisphosphate aldolase [Ferrimicrobium sp.]